ARGAEYCRRWRTAAWHSRHGAATSAAEADRAAACPRLTSRSKCPAPRHAHIQADIIRSDRVIAANDRRARRRIQIEASETVRIAEIAAAAGRSSDAGNERRTLGAEAVQVNIAAGRDVVRSSRADKKERA